MELINEENVTQHISFAEIIWKIKNISLAICPLQRSIESDEFQISGIVDTFWRLTLNVSREQNKVMIHLKMIGPEQEFYSLDTRERGLPVNWKSNFLDTVGELASSSEFTYHFNYRDNTVVETFTLTDVLNILPHFGPDDLILKCHILIDHGKKIFNELNVPYGLIELSNALVKLPTEPFFPDINVKVGKKTLHLHKDMFFNVRAMSALISQQNANNIKLLNYDYKSLECIFRYAYSGNLNSITSIPTITIYEDIKRMDVPELGGVYPKEIIPLESNLVGRAYVTKWKIENFELIQESLDGPELSEIGMNSVWKIRMHPQGKANSNDMEKKYVSLEAHLLWNNTPNIDVNVEFCSVNEKDEIIFSRREHKRMVVEDKLELPFFRNGGTLMRKCLINKDLHLRITLWISTDNVVVSTGHVTDPVPFELNNRITLNLLSCKMSHILANPLNCDMVLISGNFQQRSHKFVLGSRSPFINARLSLLPGAAFNIPVFDRHFVRVFVEYLYTGLLTDMELASNCHMFEFGFMFEVNHLRILCQEEITPQSVLAILEYADDNNLLKVKDIAFKLLAQVGEDITNHSAWDDFLRGKTNLALNVLNYLGVDTISSN